MHKETIAKILLIGLMTLLSCKAQKNNDHQLLELILKELKYEKRDSIYLVNTSNNSNIKTFFRFRNTKEVGYRLAFKDGRIVPNDTLFYKYDTIIFKPRPVKNDSYLRRGKGVTEMTENFLKDSFNYATDFIKWNYDAKNYNIFKEDELKMGKRLMISKPVYNLKQDKAIVFKSLTSRTWLGEKAIYFFQKKGNQWELIFKQEEQ